MTAGQKQALTSLFAKYGLPVSKDLFNFATVFDHDAKIALEIGFGNGDATIDIAKNHPEFDIIGIEVHEPGVGRLLANIEKNGLTNVRVIMHDAVEVLQNNIPDNSLDRVMIFFPDPWPKKKHQKRRLIQPQFVELLVSKLKEGGIIHCATDWEDYAQQMLSVLSDNPHLQNTSDNDGYVERPEFRPLTKFENRGQQLGHGVWDLIFVKTKN